MATLRHTASLSLTNSDGRSFNPKYDDRQTVVAADPETDLFNWSVGTSEADLALINVTTADAVVLITNLDDSNFVTYGPKSGGVMIGLAKLKPGETHKLRLVSGTTLRAIADTAAVLLQVAAIDA